MLKLLSNFLVFSIFIFPTIRGFSENDEHSILVLNQSSILGLVNSSDGAILCAEENGKVYLNPKAIFATEQGLFLKTKEGKDMQIPFLASSYKGCYTILEMVDSTVYPVIRCRNCNLPFSPTFFNKGVCPHCGTQN